MFHPLRGNGILIQQVDGGMQLLVPLGQYGEYGMEVVNLFLKIVALVSTFLVITTIIMTVRNVRNQTHTKITDIFPLLRNLVYWFDSNGIVVLNHKNTDFFIQFSRYQISDDNFGISFDFPVTSWSERFVGDLKGVIERHKLSYTEDHDLALKDEKMKAQGFYFICVDFGKDAKLASAFSYDVFTDVFGLERDTTVKINGFKGQRANAVES